MTTEFASRRVLVMGLGRFGGGVGVTRFLVERGARVLVTDLEKADKLTASLRQLDGLDVEYRLGEHRESDFTSADLIVVNPAVNPHENRFLKAAAAARVPLTSEIRLLVGHLPNRDRTIGITGTAGKSTTTAMIGHILAKEAHAGRITGAHVGGNIGGSLLGRLDQIGPEDWIVLELSSFMLEGLRDDHWSPHIAVVTNFSANHLDWHGTEESYRWAKQAILDHQVKGDAAILGPGIHDRFQVQAPRTRVWELDDVRRMPPVPLLVPGEHNQVNATMAIDAVESAIGLQRDSAARLLADFPGLPHRLQFVCDYAGVRYFNDSKATTPQATILAIGSFPRGVVHVILGGYDKGSDMTELAHLAREHCRAIYTIGQTGDAIAQAATGGIAQVVPSDTLDGALQNIASRIRQGDVVLLSPACASWGQFENYEQRGSRFVEAVLKYTGEGAPTPAPPAAQ